MEIVLVFAVILIGSCLQRISGMGVGLIAGPVLSLAIGPVEGIMIVNALALLNAVLTSISMRENINWRRYAVMSSVLILGAVPGALLVGQASAEVLQATVGGLLLIGLAVTTFGLQYVPRAQGVTPMLGAGAAAGFMNTVAGLAGPALTVYAQANRWEQNEYAATLQPIFATAAVVSILSKVTLDAGTLGETDPGIWVAGVAAMLLGISAGILLSRRVAKHQARKLALLLAAGGGVVALARGLAGMF